MGKRVKATTKDRARMAVKLEDLAELYTDLAARVEDEEEPVEMIMFVAGLQARELQSWITQTMSNLDPKFKEMVAKQNEH